MNISVIVVTYNSEETIQDCLNALLRSKNDYGDLDIIVIDNFSNDFTREILLNYKDSIKLVFLNKNYGFAGGVRRGLRYAYRDKYFALLNPDTIPTENWLNELIRAMEQDYRIGAAQSLLLNLDGSIDSAGGFINFLGYPIELGKKANLQLFKDRDIYDVEYAKGAAALFRWSSYLHAGGFDERFFFYYDETDLCYRLRKAGYRVVLVPSSIVYHKGLGSDIPWKELFVLYYMERNHLLFLYKNMPYRLPLALTWSIMGMVKERGARFNVRLRALSDFMRLLMKRRVNDPVDLSNILQELNDMEQV